MSTVENSNRHFVVLLVTTTDSPYALSFARQSKKQTQRGNKEGYGGHGSPQKSEFVLKQQQQEAAEILSKPASTENEFMLFR